MNRLTKPLFWLTTCKWILTALPFVEELWHSPFCYGDDPKYGRCFTLVSGLLVYLTNKLKCLRVSLPSNKGRADDNWWYLIITPHTDWLSLLVFWPPKIDEWTHWNMQISEIWELDQIMVTSFLTHMSSFVKGGRKVAGATWVSKVSFRRKTSMFLGGFLIIFLRLLFSSFLFFPVFKMALKMKIGLIFHVGRRMNEWMISLVLFYKLDVTEFIKGLQFLTAELSQESIAEQTLIL